MSEDFEVHTRLISALSIIQWSFILFGLGSFLIDYSRTTCLAGLLIFGIAAFISWYNKIHIAFFSLGWMTEEDPDEY